MPDIRVVIIEDQNEMRDGLAGLIQRSEGFLCSYRFFTGAAASAGAAEDQRRR